jgi:serine/threonine protein phosphatase PrpC
MQCSNCGAELRPRARFCNRCGAPVETADISTQPIQVATADVPPAEEADESSTGKRRRPPRPLRVRDGEDAPASHEDGAVADDVASAAPEAHPAEPDAEAAPAETASVPAPEDRPAEEATTASFDDELPLDEAPTMEYQAIAAGSSSPSASAPRVEAPAAVATSPGDGLPWPLPASMIVGGRYRVEELLKTENEGRNAENIYQVSDLQAYEQCWACGAEHGIEASSEQYCPECGADMLARVFLMYERLLMPDDAEAAETDEEDPHEAPTLRDVPVEGGERVFEQGMRLYRVVPRSVEEVLFPRGPRIVGTSASDAGLTRPADHNEDSLGLVIFNTTHNSRSDPFVLAAVADGLGGHASGMDASRAVIRALIETVLREALLPGWGDDGAAQELDAEALLREGASAANRALYEVNKASQIDSGSTLVAALIFGDTACIANMGDSRAYALDRGQLRRVSVDHSLVQQFVSAGMITDEERYTHPQRNQVFRSLGTEDEIEPDIFMQKLRPGMRFLLCSDGLWEMVRDDEIGRILRDSPTVQQACDTFIAAANAHGGEDNIAVVVLEVNG